MTEKRLDDLGSLGARRRIVCVVSQEDPRMFRESNVGRKDKKMNMINLKRLGARLAKWEALSPEINNCVYVDVIVKRWQDYTGQVADADSWHRGERE